MNVLWTFCGQGHVLILRIVKAQGPCPLLTGGLIAAPLPCHQLLEGAQKVSTETWPPSGLPLALRQPSPTPPEGFSHSSDAITGKELQAISETIYRVDTNKAQKEDIILNSQKYISPSETRDQVDHCPEP